MRHLYWMSLVAALAAATGCEEAKECDCGKLDTGSSPLDNSVKKDSMGATATPAAALKKILDNRRSAAAVPGKRSFSTKALSREDVTAMLWAAQGVNRPGLPTGRPDAKGLRTSPSAGALYPIELYVAADNVTGMNAGLYWYRPEKDTAQATGKKGKLAQTIAAAALDQQVLKQATATFIITAVGQRTAKKYGTHAEAYIYMEMGHVAQNILLMAAARGIHARPVAAMDKKQMTSSLNLPSDHVPAYIIPVGQKP